MAGNLELAQDGGTRAQIIWGVGGYMIISSLLLVLNKLAVHSLKAPSFLLFAQLFASWVSVKAAAACGIIECDELSVKKVKDFGLVALIFLGAIFSNIKTLQYCNVETFIVFRCGSPLIICVADWFFLGRELPSKRSVLSLIIILMGAVMYVLTDGNFNVTGYAWVLSWLVIFVGEQIYVKHIGACPAVSVSAVRRRHSLCFVNCLLPLLSGQWTTSSSTRLGAACITRT